MLSQIKRDQRSEDENITPLLPRDTKLDANSVFDNDNNQQLGQSSELALLWQLAWPLFFQTLANEAQMVLTMALYGHLGEIDLAVANDMNSMVWFALVFVGGAQNVVYSMVPQAKGAGSRRQVGVLLQLTIFWSVIILGPLTYAAVYFMGDVIISFGWVQSSASQSGSSGNELSEHDAMGLDESAAMRSFAHVSALWIIPYALVTTVTTWLDSISIVKAPSFISAIWAVILVAMAWWFMYKGFHVSSTGPGCINGANSGVWCESASALGLNGFAYASAICYAGQLLTLYGYVFVYRQLHRVPGEEVWFGWELRQVFDRQLNKRFLALAAPMIVQYALNSW